MNEAQVVERMARRADNEAAKTAQMDPQFLGVSGAIVDHSLLFGSLTAPREIARGW